ncbi:MAG TPA: alpha/beta hydrolase [Bryobacteraceae bacterium]|nr:alpha/beta hydrolase [Bryobacteraceae bacterium]
MYFRQWGSNGPAVVLVHGHVVSSRYMVPLGEALAPHCRVFAPDLPGSGKSPKPPRALDIPQLADALGDFIVARGLDSPVLIGNSMGCQIICDLVTRKGMAGRVVLQSPTTDGRARKLYVLLGRFFRSAIHEQRLIPLAAIYLSDLAQAGPFRSWDTLQFMLRDRIEDKRVDVPALIVRGEYDFIVPDSWVRHLAEVWPNASLLTLAGVAHGLHYSATELFVDAILPFVTGEPA